MASKAPPVAACASTPGGGSTLTVVTYNIGANSDEMFQCAKGREFKEKLVKDEVVTHTPLSIWQC